MGYVPESRKTMKLKDCLEKILKKKNKREIMGFGKIYKHRISYNYTILKLNVGKGININLEVFKIVLKLAFIIICF